jgi:hypothetical protein
MSNHFQNEIAFLGIESSPTFIRAPGGNGSAEGVQPHALDEDLQASPAFVRLHSALNFGFCLKVILTNRERSKLTGSRRATVRTLSLLGAACRRKGAPRVT